MVDSSLLGANFIYGLGIGYALGFFVKKAIKLFVIILGFYVMSLFYLAEKGIIIVDQQKLNTFVEESSKRLIESFYTFGYATANSLGVVSGFLLGFKTG